MTTSSGRPPASSASKAAPAYHHGDLRPTLLAAAEALLTCQGAAALSLREVARAAGVSHGAPYRHFPNREALLAALAAQGFERLSATIAATVAGPCDGDRMRTAGRAYLRFARDNQALYLLMFGPEIRKADHPALMSAAASAMTALRTATSGISATPPNARRARHVAVGAWALVHGLAQLIADGQLNADLIADGGAALSEDVLAAYSLGLRHDPQ